MSRIDLRRAFKQLFRQISQMHSLATTVGEFVFIEATKFMGLRNTCQVLEELWFLADTPEKKQLQMMVAEW